MTREEAIKQFMMNQMSDRSEDFGFYLLGEIYDDFESREKELLDEIQPTCENCVWYDRVGACSNEESMMYDNLSYDKFGCNEFSCKDTKGKEDD